MEQKLSQSLVDNIVRKYGDVIPGLESNLSKNIINEFEVENQLRFTKLGTVPMDALRVISNENGEIAAERIIATAAGARPVVKILDDKVTTEFLGKYTDNSPWKDVIIEAQERLNKWIPAVGRIELKNGDVQWVGTGWMIDEGIIVTNAHVAEIFGEADQQKSTFVFKPGFTGGFVSAQIDFLEEQDRANSIEHPITSVLWIASAEDADVSFLKVERGEGKPELPRPVEMADTIETGAAIAAIGYPARDPSIRDQDLVISIFGSDVYDKKRLSPGKVMRVVNERFEHDCSTLGGNSGSLVVEFKTGKAIGLHQGGYLNDSANLGITVTHLRALLENVKKTLKKNNAKNSTIPEIIKSDSTMENENDSKEIKLNLHIPLEVTIRIGQVVSFAGGQLQQNLLPGVTPAAGSVDAALNAAEKMFKQDEDVINVRPGYRFKNGWITDEKVIVVEVKEKLEFKNLLETGKKPFPREIMGIGIDVRTAPLPDQLDSMKIDLVATERKGKPAGYSEPDGYDDPTSDMFLKRVKEKMTATFHVSPDEGFKNLSAFLGRTREQIVATIYEWEPNHISDAIEAAMDGDGKTLKMVTQRTGVAERDATRKAVDDMMERIGDKFSHVWASTRGKNRLIPNSYHIKVACRDGEELWLSSGNWKKSNQPKNPTAASSLDNYNREWHAVIQNDTLTQLFQRYIEYDFEQATLYPTEITESLPFADVELFVPIAAFSVAPERLRDISYNPELTLTNELIDIQPLLTPDKDAENDSMFIKHATNMIRRATRTIYVQNQSFNMTDDNNPELDEFFEELRKKQRSIGDVRIIFRDAADYGRPADLTKQQLLIERLKDYGFDTSRKRLRLQKKCHTKGIIVDSREVLLGSQNITNGGALFNRDASLLVRNRKVAEFFEQIFLYDWENLAHNNANERIGGIRLASVGEAAPEGFVRMKLSELLGERE